MNRMAHYQSLSDADLVVVSKSGDRSALAYLLRRNYNQMFAIALRYTRSLELAKDAVQEACVQIIRNIDGLREEARFSSWMGRIVVNSVRLHYRKFGRDVLAGDVLEKVGVEPGPSPDSVATHRHELDEVHQFLSSRTNDDLDLFKRLFIHGQSFNAISDEVGVSISALKTRVHRARKGLRYHMISAGFSSSGDYRPDGRAVS